MKCIKCGNEFELTQPGKRDRIKKGTSLELCKTCVRREAIINARANVSEEKKKAWGNKISKARKKEWAALSNDEKKRRGDKLKLANTNYRNNISDEDKTRNIEKQKASINKYWKNVSDEEKARRGQKTSAYWNSLSDEEKAKRNAKSSKTHKETLKKWTNEQWKLYGQKRKDCWSNLPEEEKQRRLTLLHNGAEEFRNNTSNVEKQRIYEIVSSKVKEYRTNLSDEEKERIKNLQSKTMKENWINMPDEIKQIHIEHAQKGLQEYWNAISDEDRIRHFYLTAEGMSNNYTYDPTISEIDFINNLNLYKFKYKYQWNNKTINKEFYNYYTINDNPYHVWDFNIHTVDGDILVDIDGSMHTIPVGVYITKDDNIDVGATTQYKDAKRKYETDGLQAYIIEAYKDILEDETKVLNLNTGEYLNYKDFLSLIKWMNLNNKDKKKIINCK